MPERAQPHIDTIKRALLEIEQQDIGGTQEQRKELLRDLDNVRGSICIILASHLTDARRDQFDDLASQCDENVIHESTLGILRYALLRTIAAERFDIPFDMQRNVVVRGVLLHVHSYSFREDLPYKGDRSVLKEILKLFPEATFLH